MWAFLCKNTKYGTVEYPICGEFDTQVSEPKFNREHSRILKCGVCRVTNTISDYHFEKYTDQFEIVNRQLKEMATLKKDPVDIKRIFKSLRNQDDDSIQGETDEL